MTGSVRTIHVAPAQGESPERVDSVQAYAGRGLEGDRYCVSDPQPDDSSASIDQSTAGTFADRDGSDLTLIEHEAIAAVERDYGIALDPGVHRRNITTTNIALNHLVGETFRIGSVRCKGVELCEPCPYLERHLEIAGLREAFVHRGGLRARILEDGIVSEGDPIERC